MTYYSGRFLHDILAQISQAGNRHSWSCSAEDIAFPPNPRFADHLSAVTQPLQGFVRSAGKEQVRFITTSFCFHPEENLSTLQPGTRPASFTATCFSSSHCVESSDPPQQLHRRRHPPRARTVFAPGAGAAAAPAPAPGAAAATDVEDRTPGLPTKPGTGDAAAFDAMTGNVLQKGESPLNNVTAQSTDGSQSSESNEKSLQGVRVDQAERLVDQIQDSLDEIFNPKVESLGSGAGGTGAGGAGDQDTSMDEPAQPSLGAEEVKEIQEKLAIMQKAAFEDLPQAERFVENAIHTIDRKVNNMKKLLAS